MTKHISHTGVYAVILNTIGDHILLIVKARGPYTGLLDLPGGRMDIGETPDDALIREVAEETSCRVLDRRQLGTFQADYPYLDPSTGQARLLHHTGLLYAATVCGVPSPAGDGIDSGGAIWAKICDINNSKVTPFVGIGLQLIRGVYGE